MFYNVEEKKLQTAKDIFFLKYIFVPHVLCLPNFVDMPGASWLLGRGGTVAVAVAVARCAAPQQLRGVDDRPEQRSLQQRIRKTRTNRP